MRSSLGSDCDSIWECLPICEFLEVSIGAENGLEDLFAFGSIGGKRKAMSWRAISIWEALQNKVCCADQLDNVVGLVLFGLKNKQPSSCCPSSRGAKSRKAPAWEISDIPLSVNLNLVDGSAISRIDQLASAQIE